MGPASSLERKIRVGGSTPHLPRGESGRRITPAVAYNLVLPLLVETKPVEKVGQSNAAKPKEEKPPLQRTGICGRCRQSLYFREGWKKERCFGCSGD